MPPKCLHNYLLALYISYYVPYQSRTLACEDLHTYAHHLPRSKPDPSSGITSYHCCWSCCRCTWTIYTAIMSIITLRCWYTMMRLCISSWWLGCGIIRKRMIKSENCLGGHTYVGNDLYVSKEFTEQTIFVGCSRTMQNYPKWILFCSLIWVVL